jgi:hypothetical protein
MTTQILGLDAAAACTSSMISCLQQNNIGFLGRYYSSTTHIAGKKLTLDEAQIICAGGLQIVTVYEDAPTDYAYFSAARGTSDATAAMQQATAIGQPATSAIYFSVDYDAAPDEVTGNITAYFEAVRSAIAGAYGIGVYGSGLVCASIIEAGLASYGWLCGSTGYRDADYAGWVIKQGLTESLCNASWDTDVAQGDFGAFSISASS